MKKIIDYANQNVAIYCSSKEEWDKIVDLFDSPTVKKHYWKDVVNYLGKSDTINITGRGWSFKEHFIKKQYTIYPASDFLEEEPKFDEGKWYKNIGKDDKAYAKCKKFEKNCFYLSDHISKDKQYRLYTDGSYFSEKNYQNAELLTDLSEIQQYLPEGHPDKVKPFKFNIGDEIKAKPGGYYFSYPKGFAESHKKQFPSSESGILGKITERTQAQGFNWYRCGHDNWRTEEGVGLIKEDIPDLIPKGYQTLFRDEGTDYRERIFQSEYSVCPENNRWKANIPAEYFQIVEDEKHNDIPKECYSSNEIIIPQVIKAQKTIQKITIESPTELDLKLKTIKPKQIQTIKI